MVVLLPDPDEPDEPVVVEPEVPAVELLLEPLVLGVVVAVLLLASGAALLVEPVLPVALPLVLGLALVLGGVPVVPIGVLCVLCWPAPVAGSGLAEVGGVAWAMAVPTTATVARPASRPFNWVDAIMFELLDVIR